MYRLTVVYGDRRRRAPGFVWAASPVDEKAYERIHRKALRVYARWKWQPGSNDNGEKG